MKNSVNLAMALIALAIVSANARCIDIFYNPTCPHCQDELSFLYSISSKYNLTINQYDVLDPKVMPLFLNLSEYYNSSGDVPLTLVGNKAFIGFAYGNETQQINSRLYAGYSGALLQAIISSGNACPSLIDVSTMVCKANTTSCATVVTPSQAKGRLAENSLISIGEGVALIIAIIVAALLGVRLKRRKL